MFFDEAKIYIESGKGGDGHVSFRRELYVANGGPDGGDGGKGGDIIFEVEKGLNTLADFRHTKKYIAPSGEEGGKRRCHGKNAEDLVIKVPEGTVVYDEKTGKIVADMSGENLRQVILQGGDGGIGNMHYATSTMQVPKYAKPGKPGRSLTVRLELKVIADVGLIGFPSAGKSTLISAVSNARPKVAAYHFTTLTPVLGVVRQGDSEFIMADIPGIIEGASDGAGLGLQFLKHIERCKILLQVVDAAGTEGRDPFEDIEVIRNELKKHDENLLKKPMILVLNKMDSFDFETLEAGKTLTELVKEKYPGEYLDVFEISAAAHQNTKELVNRIGEVLSQLPKETLVYTPDFIYEYDRDFDLPYTIENPEPHVFVIEGPRIEKMLGYTNLDSEKGFRFFQEFIVKTGIEKELKEKGIEEGDTVRMYGHAFDFYE